MITPPAFGKIDPAAPVKSYKKNLQAFAARIFSEATGSKLRVLAFGTDDEENAPLEYQLSSLVGEREYWTRYWTRTCFMRGSGSNGLAEGSSLAVEVDEEEVKWLEVESELLQYPFSL